VHAACQVLAKRLQCADVAVLAIVSATGVLVAEVALIRRLHQVRDASARRGRVEVHVDVVKVAYLDAQLRGGDRGGEGLRPQLSLGDPRTLSD
jgi:hypothetical protein